MRRVRPTADFALTSAAYVYGMRPFLYLLSAVFLAGPLAACKTTYGCLEIDGPCYGPARPASFIVGVEPAVVDKTTAAPSGGYRAFLHVGDTVTLHFVRDAQGEITTARDTIRAVEWGLSDSVAATIVPAAGGSALLIASHIGRVGLVFANGITNGPYSCGLLGPGAYGCARVGEVDVIAR
jgi:hypothetical protein